MNTDRERHVYKLAKKEKWRKRQKKRKRENKVEADTLKNRGVR